MIIYLFILKILGIDASSDTLLKNDIDFLYFNNIANYLLQKTF